MTPLMSIIIPTANRPQYLPRAVESALTGMALDEIEVIVVPNGPDISWKQSLASYATNPSVRILPISTAHANAARNHGMAHARGKFIRFLDDDDFLIQPQATEQVVQLERSGDEISSGLLLNVDKDLSPLGALTFPQTHDFVAATCTLSGFRLNLSKVYLLQTLESCRASWREDVPRAQDLIWLLDLATLREWKWHRYNHPVGAWFQHDSDRVSTVKLRHDKPVKAIEAIFHLHKELSATNRLTNERTQAIASLLWNYIHWRFPYNVVFWTKVAVETLKLCPESSPDHPIFESFFLKQLHPIFAELCLALPRKLTTRLRDIKNNWTGWDYRRTL